MAFVMLIDDDKEPMRFYVMALKQKGYEVKQVGGPDQAMEYVLGKDNPRPDIIILDIMLPPGKRYEGNAACDRGLRTGLLLYPELKAHCQSVPVIVLTNLKQAEQDFKKVDPSVLVVQKMHTPPFELVTRLEEIMSHNQTR